MPHKCDQCDYKGALKPNIEKHKLSKHEGVRFKCTFCPRTFSTKGILHKHNRIKHINHDKLKCPHCEWSFSERGNLNAHVRRKHENEKFYCDRCEKSISIFGKKKHLRLHKKRDQQKIQPGPDGVIHCDQCDYKARRRVYFNRHYNIEHGKIRFTCNQCEFESKNCLLYTSPSPRD